jgi:cytochrome P450
MSAVPGWQPVWPRFDLVLRSGLRAAFLPSLEAARRRGGDFVRLRGLAGPMLLVSDPDAIEHLLVRNWRNYLRGEARWTYLARGVGAGVALSEGEAHQRQVRMLKPLLAPKHTHAFFREIAEIPHALANEWSARRDQVVDLHGEMLNATLRMLARILFREDITPVLPELEAALTTASEAPVELDASLGGLLYFVPTALNRRFRSAVAFADGLLDLLIEEIRRGGARDDSILGQLVRGQQAAGPDERITDRELKHHVISLFAGGFESTAAMLTWTWYLLACNPEVERRLHEELDRVLGERPARFEDLRHLEYATRVLHESLRLYPPSWVFRRVAREQDRCAGRLIPAGATVFFSPWLVQRDARWFPDPQRFDPDRFAPERARSRPRFSFFPFGAGDRSCLGRHIALLVGLLLLSSLAQRFAPALPERHETRPDPWLSVRPMGGLPMRLVARGDRAGPARRLER